MMRTVLVFMFALLVASPSAHALEESTRRPFYVQGTVGSFSLWTNFSFGDQVYWHPDVEFGFHFTGRHDGLVIGVRQAFDVGRDPYSMGETMVRVGYDLALPFKNGRYEVTIAPFGTLGADYFFRGPNAGVRFSLGVEGKLFFYQGLFVVVRAIELSMGEFVNLGPFYKNVYFNLNAGLGAGYAF